MSDGKKRCAWCSEPITGRVDKKYCNAGCRHAAFIAREKVSEANLYEPILERWRESGQKDLKHMINVALAAMFGIDAEELERYRNGEEEDN